MTRPDVFGLAREVLAYTDGLGDLDARRLATALLALEPLLDALDVWRTTKPNYAQIRAVRHLIAMHDTARAALGRETT